MKSVLNAAVRRNLQATAERMGPTALQAAAQGIRFRTEDDIGAAKPSDAPADEIEVAPASPSLAPSTSQAGQPLANYLAAKRVGDMLYLSGVIAVDPASKRVITSYDDLPAHAREQLRKIGYDTGQLSVDIFEAPIVAQSWFVLSRIEAIAKEHGAIMQDAFKLVQYFRDLRHYPAYNRVRSLFCPEGVVSTVVEVSRMLPSDEVLIEVEAMVVLNVHKVA
jgi:enamine deaminase RidA (YjgF/YER057c/UK114 family)